MIPHEKMFDLVEKHPRLALALGATVMLDTAIYRQWLTTGGRLSAYARIAHLLCELSIRLDAVGLCTEGSYALPLTQNDIGDATNLSTVHVNRTLKKLRAAGLITLHSNILVVLDKNR